jgi:hypothetical protein
MELITTLTEGDSYHLRLRASQALHLYTVFRVLGAKVQIRRYRVTDIHSLHQHAVLEEG